VNDDRPTGRPERVDERLAVERRERAEVDHLAVDALVGEFLGGDERRPGRGPVGDHRNVRALAADRRLAEGDLVVVDRDGLLVGAVEPLRLEHDHGVGVAHRGREQPLGVPRSAGDDDLQPRLVAEERLRRLGVVLRGADARAVRHPDGQRAGEPAARPRPHACGVGDQLVERRVGEAHELDLRDGPEAVGRHPDGRPGDAGLRERRVDDPVPAELVDQALGRAEDAAVLADVLAEDDDAVVAGEFRAQALADGADEVEPLRFALAVDAGLRAVVDGAHR
jgi:hypothetical protein